MELGALSDTTTRDLHQRSSNLWSEYSNVLQPRRQMYVYVPSPVLSNVAGRKVKYLGTMRRILGPPKPREQGGPKTRQAIGPPEIGLAVNIVLTSTSRRLPKACMMTKTRSIGHTRSQFRWVLGRTLCYVISDWCTCGTVYTIAEETRKKLSREEDRDAGC